MGSSAAVAAIAVALCCGSVASACGSLPACAQHTAGTRVVCQANAATGATFSLDEVLACAPAGMTELALRCDGQPLIPNFGGSGKFVPFASLAFLEVQGCGLASLSAADLAGPTSWNRLDLTGNLLTRIPLEVIAAHPFVTVSLRDNALLQAPAAGETLIAGSLRVLSLRNTNVGGFPAGFWSSTTLLTSLDLFNAGLVDGGLDDFASHFGAGPLGANLVLDLRQNAAHVTAAAGSLDNIGVSLAPAGTATFDTDCLVSPFSPWVYDSSASTACPPAASDPPLSCVETRSRTVTYQPTAAQPPPFSKVGGRACPALTELRERETAYWSEWSEWGECIARGACGNLPFEGRTRACYQWNGVSHALAGNAACGGNAASHEERRPCAAPTTTAPQPCEFGNSGADTTVLWCDSDRGDFDLEGIVECGGPDLTTLVLECHGDALLRDIPADGLDSFPLLNALDVRACGTENLGAASLRGLSSLNSLRLPSNALTELPLATLPEVPALKVLDLRSNPIGSPDPSAVMTAPELQTLIILNSQVSGFGANFWSQVPALRSVTLLHAGLTNGGLDSFIARFASTEQGRNMKIDIRSNAGYTYAGDGEWGDIGSQSGGLQTDCLVTSFGAWSAPQGDCPAPPGAPALACFEERARSVSYAASKSGRACPYLREVRPSGAAAPANTWGPWSSWSQCDASCGGGSETRTRSCLGVHGQPLCSGSNCEAYENICGAGTGSGTDTRTGCAPEPCSTDRDCKLGAWSAWGSCSKTCGSGQQVRTRRVTQHPRGLGASCGDLAETRACNEASCGSTGVGGGSVPCAGCLFNTRGPCKTRHGVCFSYLAGGKGICPPGTAECGGPPTPCITTAGSWGQCTAECGRQDGVQTHVKLVAQPAGDGGACTSLVQTRSCGAEPCVDCVVGEWGDWSPCKNDSPSQVRTRAVVTPATGTGAACPPLQEERRNVCVVDCSLSEWGDWGSCSSQCGGGVQKRQRLVVAHGSNGGTPCPVASSDLEEARGCNADECPPGADCVAAPAFGAFSACSAQCGTGVQVALRDVVTPAVGSGQCHVELYKTRPCTIEVTPDNCFPGVEGNGVCTDCFGRTTGPCKSRNGVCYSFFPHLLGGASEPLCPGGTNQCSLSARREIDCAVSPWSPWSACSGDACEGAPGGPGNLGSGRQTRTRTVLTRHTAGGRSCPKLVEERACPASCAARDCVVGPWSVWSGCSQACGGGTRSRSRGVLAQPAPGGAACPPLSQSDICNAQDCDNSGGGGGGGNTPIPCAVSAWGEWSPCLPESPQQVRRRTVTQQPKNGGAACPPPALLYEYRSNVCVVDCIMSDWTDWSGCSQACGTGLRTRRRQVLHPAANGGIACSATQQSAACNTHKCTGCTGCLPGTRGECKHNGLNVCYFAWNGNCPAGTTRCLPAPTPSTTDSDPGVLATLSLANIPSESTDATSIQMAVAKVIGGDITPEHVIVESLQVGGTTRAGYSDVEVTVRVIAPGYGQVTPTEVADRISTDAVAHASGAVGDNRANAETVVVTGSSPDATEHGDANGQAQSLRVADANVDTEERNGLSQLALIALGCVGGVIVVAAGLFGMSRAVRPTAELQKPHVGSPSASVCVVSSPHASSRTPTSAIRNPSPRVAWS